MTVTDLFEYPVKGLHGNKICCASVNKRGLKMDRRWMIVDSENSFLSQRQIPALTQLLPSFQDSLTLKDLSAETSIDVNLIEFNSTEEVEVWGQVVTAKKGPEVANRWLTERVGQPVKLVFMDEENNRPVRQGSEGDIVSFADGYPLLLTGSASLEDLNSRLESPIGIDRFRTNIHVHTTRPFEEEDWRRIKIGDVIFKVVKKCARCQVINIDQVTGKPSKEPLRTLATYRKEGNKVNFGMNLIPETLGLIHEGDSVEILA